jgi:hypothetical protein
MQPQPAQSGYAQPGYPPPQQAYAPPPPAAAAPSTEDKLAQLKQLGELKESGILTDAEFDAQKAQILAS